MPTAKKLPSGTWRVRVYSHSDPDGKQHYKTITAPTKQEAESLAAKWKAKANRLEQTDLTIKEAIDGYITAKSGVLSPATIHGYRSLERNYFDGIGHIRIKKLNNAVIQTFISDLSVKVSAKTVSNIYGLLTAAIALYAPEMTFKVKLPTKSKKRRVAPSDAQILALFNSASPNLKKAIAFAAFTSMRRGEICALKYADIDGNRAHVHADIVHSPHGGWIYKPTPKTSDSDRFVMLPDIILELIGTGAPDDYVVPLRPDTITQEFCELRDVLGLPYHFHDLRRYFASKTAALQIPDAYIETFGGWRAGSGVMKEVYQSQMDQEADVYAQKITQCFDKMVQNGHDIGSKNMTRNMTRKSETLVNTGVTPMTPTGIEDKWKCPETPNSCGINAFQPSKIGACGTRIKWGLSDRSDKNMT